jgi:hypothetical protein
LTWLIALLLWTRHWTQSIPSYSKKKKLNHRPQFRVKFQRDSCRSRALVGYSQRLPKKNVTSAFRWQGRRRTGGSTWSHKKYNYKGKERRSM